MMRAACCPAARIIELRDVATPAPAAGEVVVRVRVCGICGSDLHWFTGHAALPPVCPGHEMAGEVAAVGAGVSGWRAGDRVAVEPLRSCGVCRYCRHRTPQLCVRLQIFGLQLAGGFADAVVVPATALFAVPPQLDWPIAVLAEPTAVAVHAVRLAGIAAGQRVLILGAGAIGLLCVLAASAAGAEVWVSARYAHQAALARRLGAARVFATSETAQAERRALAAEHGIDVVPRRSAATATPWLTRCTACVRAEPWSCSACSPARRRCRRSPCSSRRCAWSAR
jgi:threonine dehydrogenase-like Zn-dependent dehydrogenase